MLAASAGALVELGIPLQNLETFTESLIVYDFALAQKVQRLDDFRVCRHVHEVFVGGTGFLFCCNHPKSTEPKNA